MIRYGKQMLIICDVDGTIVDNQHRQHLVPEDVSIASNWDDFSKACKNDKPVCNIINQVKDLYDHCVGMRDLIFLTSRGESAESETLEQLNQLFDLNHYQWQLAMRPMDCHEGAVNYKRKALPNLIDSLSIDRPIILFDDHPEIIKMVQAEFQSIIAVQVPSTCTTINKGTECLKDKKSK